MGETRKDVIYYYFFIEGMFRLKLVLITCAGPNLPFLTQGSIINCINSGNFAYRLKHNKVYPYINDLYNN